MSEALAQGTQSLLPCPFCGGEAAVVTIEPHSHAGGIADFMPDHPGSAYIDCACGVGIIDANADAVSKRWNRRASTPPSSEPVAWRKAFYKLLRTASLLQQNSIGCAVNHHGLDVELNGLPGWLDDTKKEIDAAEKFLNAHQPAAAAEREADSDLVQRCREIIEWNKTGLLAGGNGGALRALADRLKEKIGDHYALSVAEKQTADEAMKAVAATPHSPVRSGGLDMPDDELAAWARNWHWNDCAEDRPVDPSIYFRDMRMLKAFILKARAALNSGGGK